MGCPCVSACARVLRIGDESRTELSARSAHPKVHPVRTGGYAVLTHARAGSDGADEGACGSTYLMWSRLRMRAGSRIILTHRSSTFRRCRAGLAGEDPPVFEDEEGRYRLNGELPRRLRCSVHVHLHELELSCPLLVATFSSAGLTCRTVRTRTPTGRQAPPAAPAPTWEKSPSLEIHDPRERGLADAAPDAGQGTRFFFPQFGHETTALMPSPRMRSRRCRRQDHPREHSRVTVAPSCHLAAEERPPQPCFDHMADVAPQRAGAVHRIVTAVSDELPRVRSVRGGYYAPPVGRAGR